MTVVIMTGTKDRGIEGRSKQLISDYSGRMGRKAHAFFVVDGVLEMCIDIVL